MRRESFCTECYAKFKSSRNNNGKEENISTNTGTTYKSSKRFIHAFKELQKRLSEECRVIENCLRATNQSVSGYPVFDPDNRVFYPDYPHFRMPVTGENTKFPSNGGTGLRRRGNKRESSVYNVECEVNMSGKTEHWSINFTEFLANLFINYCFDLEYITFSNSDGNISSPILQIILSFTFFF